MEAKNHKPPHTPPPPMHYKPIHWIKQSMARDGLREGETHRPVQGIGSFPELARSFQGEKPESVGGI